MIGTFIVISLTVIFTLLTLWILFKTDSEFVAFSVVPLAFVILIGCLGGYPSNISYIEAGAEPVGNAIVVAAEGYEPVVVNDIKYLTNPVYIKQFKYKNFYGVTRNQWEYEVVLTEEE